MRALHARLPKNFVLEERLERYANAIEVEPSRYVGHWAEACFPLRGTGGVIEGKGTPPNRYREVRLDLGCGKGDFTAEMARREPDVLFVGVDFEPICIAYAAERAVRARLKNMVLVSATGKNVGSIFGPGELAAIYLNFPTPFPKKKEATRRLTHLIRLMEYQPLLAPGATVLLKTDSYPLWRFSETQFRLADYTVTWQSMDARAERPDDAMSQYEERLTAKGAKVLAIEATPGPESVYREQTACREQTAPLSLVDWLPDDLDAMDYVPYGMEGTVTNLRNRRRKQRRKR